MRPQSYAAALLVAGLALTGCSGGGSDMRNPEVSDLGSSFTLTPTGDPRDDYLQAVCTGASYRLVYGAYEYLNQEYGAYSIADMRNALPDAITATRASAALLTDPGYSWPAEIADQIAQVEASERAIADDMQDLFDAGEEDFLSALATYQQRVDSPSGPGRAVRNYFGLGRAGDCPASPVRDRVFALQAKVLIPDWNNEDEATIIERGRASCPIIARAASPSDAALRLIREFLFDSRSAGVLASLAEEYVCVVRVGDPTENQAVTRPPTPSPTPPPVENPRAFIIECDDAPEFTSFTELYAYAEAEGFPYPCSTTVTDSEAFTATAEEKEAFTAEAWLEGESDAYAFEVFADYCASDPDSLMFEVTPAELPSVLIVCPDYPLSPENELFLDKSYILDDGTYDIGTEIQPGTWRTNNRPSDCYWERTSGGGDIIDNGFVTDARDGVTVTISPSDGSFTTENCGSWSRIG